MDEQGEWEGKMRSERLLGARLYRPCGLWYALTI